MKRYEIPNDVKGNGIRLFEKIYLSENRMCLITLIMSILLILVHMSNSVPPFFEVLSEVWFLLPLELLLLIPVYFVYWIGLVVFPLGFIIITYNIITEYIFHRKNRKNHFIKRK